MEAGNTNIHFSFYTYTLALNHRERMVVEKRKARQIKVTLEVGDRGERLKDDENVPDLPAVHVEQPRVAGAKLA